MSPEVVGHIPATGGDDRVDCVSFKGLVDKFREDDDETINMAIMAQKETKW